ncbi:T6SS immunity protein Tdi1 domain-containing protein [Microbacterium testaceum]|uniref:T6SS immunity protein Tdi1 domain-containing protein n=1 Tax=Microbacterium testaceum TaxID=2033 RepID=UPI001245A654|nr:T6SS immunity protein Tdi1 domain-containing protein [Microbacterium testaceum]
MTASLFEGFKHFSAMPVSSLENFSPLVEPAVLELWHAHGIGCTADGFLKLIDPAYYLTMIGEYLPRPDMIPVLATGMGDVVVAYSGKYRVLEFRYARATGGVGSSLARIGRRAADREYLEEFLDAKPYFEAVNTYGPLNSPDDIDYIFGYELPLPAGGPEGVENLTRSRIFEHIALTVQLSGPIPFAG